MDTGDGRNSANPRRSNRGGTRGAASRPPAVDDGADPNAAAGHPPREFTREWLWLQEEFSRRRERRIPVPSFLRNQFPDQEFLSLDEYVRACELTRRPRPSARRSQASSSAAPPSDHPGAERTASGTRVRQSVLYSDRPRQSRRRRPTEHVEHPSGVSSSELEGTNLQAFEALSVRDSSIAFPSETEEYPSEASSSELGRAVADLPTLGALSLRESPLLTPQTTREETDDDDDASSHIYMPRDVGPSLYSSSLNGLTRSRTRDKPRWINVSLEELRRPDSDDEDPEETKRLIRRILDARPPCTSVREMFDRMLAAQHAALTALAAEHGTELPRDPFLVDEESQLAPQHASATAAQPLATMTTSHEASTEDNNEDGKKWMRDEVKLCFKKHIEKTAHRTGLHFELDELCHQCFNVESYMKVFHHYNFKIRSKMPTSIEWTVELYFAEVKEIFGRKFYFCCPLEPNESGNCYACKNQGVDDLKHPATGGFEVGLPDAPESNFWYEDE